MNGEAAAAAAAEVELVSAECECCGMTEECTPAYMARVRERHGGRWVCGLCGEAVKDEMCRAGRRISTEEALSRHMSFSERFRSFPSTAAPADTEDHLISAMRQLLRRSLDSPRAARSTPSSPRRSGTESSGTAARRAFVRSESCLPALSQ